MERVESSSIDLHYHRHSRSCNALSGLRLANDLKTRCVNPELRSKLIEGEFGTLRKGRRHREGLKCIEEGLREQAGEFLQVQELCSRGPVPVCVGNGRKELAYMFCSRGPVPQREDRSPASLDLLVELLPWVAVPTGNHGVGSHPSLFWGVTGLHVSGAAARGKGELPLPLPQFHFHERSAEESEGDEEAKMALLCFMLDLRNIPLPSSAISNSQCLLQLANLYLVDKALYAWGGDDVSKKVIAICMSSYMKTEAIRKSLLDAAEQCVTVEFLLLDPEEENTPNDASKALSGFVNQLCDLENCVIRRYIPDSSVLNSLVKRWLEELKNDAEEPLQAVFLFEHASLGSSDRISCNLSVAPNCPEISLKPSNPESLKEEKKTCSTVTDEWEKLLIVDGGMNDSYAETSSSSSNLRF
uniref:Uncharacterized protein n=1 Tax=Ananas comosus var. bracteatus TaxID=296719 RepID=A0A6V7NGW6_ANACO|nr:unnamed protein product [Ananas comosus var. bracteatus]